MKPDMDISKLPCGACKYSAKAHQNWTVFAQEIDDVVPLGMSTHSEQLSETANVYAALS
jgi:ubiquitin C-terminal hydrolase